MLHSLSTKSKSAVPSVLQWLYGGGAVGVRNAVLAVSLSHSAEILFFSLQKLRGALQTVVVAPYTYVYVRICC